ncbi:YbbC/YhhH family protein [Flavobacterium sp. Fl-77]|uniref:YbbC/YhhH family protein n=1 Tax=Flavobacterium flavipigmentatum TaxID=2893884 RepID=A0AAJ2VZB8_9FLAO|nr:MULTISPECIES: YbbC/YhhH family protein [unclassified Flavobacterium]MDX6183587.1 YbbC/YhhH family protein [Flavobacterium sp. Fl-33]MDX6187139.1 YbbC/YhhH family protein [Flavobacterium sp. Fl-77]UFH38050.1 YbbC/YhhH family protein [Flavobacterium sp. F-70]
MNFKIAFIGLLFISLTSCGQTKSDRTQFGVEYAKSELKDALYNKKEKQILVDTVIKDKETAIIVAEAILFKIYGKDKITKQRPYEINQIDNYWVLNGTLPNNMLGGTFLIIINSKNGQIVKLTHGK